jgi:DNA-binding CsgD family transcriptional regulator
MLEMEGAMSLTLTTAETTRLAEVARTLLSPLDPADMGKYATGAAKSLRELLGGDRSLVIVPSASSPGDPLMYSDGFSSSEVDSYRRVLPIEHGIRLVRSRGWEIWSHARILNGNPSVFFGTPIYQEYYGPMGLEDGIGYVLPWADNDTFLIVKIHHLVFGTRGFGTHGYSLLEVLLPVLKAGFGTCRQLLAYRNQFSGVLDGLSEGIRLLDRRGRSLHDNTALRTMLSAEPESAKLEHAINSAAAAAAAMSPDRRTTLKLPGAPVTCDVQTIRGRYRVRAILLSNDSVAHLAAGLVSVDGINKSSLASAEELSDRFRLTRREACVANLLASGCTNEAIARSLGISRHTARRHTEHVLAKIGVSTRAAVRPAIEG